MEAGTRVKPRRKSRRTKREHEQLLSTHEYLRTDIRPKIIKLVSGPSEPHICQMLKPLRQSTVLELNNPVTRGYYNPKWRVGRSLGAWHSLFLTGQVSRVRGVQEQLVFRHTAKGCLARGWSCWQSPRHCQTRALRQRNSYIQGETLGRIPKREGRLHDRTRSRSQSQASRKGLMLLNV